MGDGFWRVKIPETGTLATDLPNQRFTTDVTDSDGSFLGRFSEVLAKVAKEQRTRRGFLIAGRAMDSVSQDESTVALFEPLTLVLR